MQFSSPQYFGSEADGFVAVDLVLFGGMTSSPFNVTINPSEMFPPSARGQFSIVTCYCLCKEYLLCYFCVGNGIDFDSNPITATFSPSSRRTTVQIPVTRDGVIEREETFNIILTLDTTNPSIMLGSITTARGTIEDSTGNEICSYTFD